MRPYFEKMTKFGHALKRGRIKSTEENLAGIQKIEDEIAGEVAETAWHDFKRIEEYIRKANKEINEVLEEIRKYNNTIRK